jgi:type IV secretory pathway TrbD component
MSDRGCQGSNRWPAARSKLLAGATGFCADPAVMHFGVAFALLGAAGARLGARVDRRAQRGIVRSRLARKRERRRGARVGTREVQADAAG